MKRTIVKIDAEKCIGCGACETACSAKIIKMENGKARVMDEMVCDGMGTCISVCPVQAIIYEETPEAIYEEIDSDALPELSENTQFPGIDPAVKKRAAGRKVVSSLKKALNEVKPITLKNWPVQLQGIDPKAPIFDGADIVISADCCGYLASNIQDFLKDKLFFIACPKLDQADYLSHVQSIFELHDIKSVTVIKIGLPCCSYLAVWVMQALRASGKNIPCDIVTVERDYKGQIYTLFP
ncbi:NAD-dependent dihydropyrimidine dehydrogenase PreA subunit [Elusimicrobium posterum]|uniref:ATP-binding protein n=1 Tax=Elusimicrobium posterum TaxID=3116653 RepID=UPI003C730CAB